VRWCAHWSLAFGHSRAWELTSGGTTGRGEHGDPSSGLTRAQAVVERRRDRGDERWWLELDVSAKEGVRELKRERKRGGEGRGCSSPFIGAEGASGGVAGAVMGSVSGFNAIEDRARLIGVKEGP
jgi:hypothetical protein